MTVTATKQKTKKAKQAKAAKVMKEFHAGKLTSRGRKVTDPAQAKAIAMAKSSLAKKKKVKGSKKK